MMRLTSLAALGAALLLTACNTTTPYSTPDVSIPDQYGHAAAGAAAESQARPVSSGPWWRSFGDPRLERLVGQVLERNNNLAAAAILVRRAQLQAGLAEENLVPQLGASGNASTTRRDGRTTDSYSASASVSYEVDLWNRLGSLRDAAQWEAEATQQDRDATELTLIGTTAGLYWQLAYLNQQIASGQQSIAYARQTLDLVRTQYRTGAASALEVNEAEQSLATQLAAQSRLDQQRVETRASIALLLGGQPWSDGPEPQALPLAPLPAVEPGLPASLLGRRPDLRAAELRLRGSLADVDATRTSYYPALSLTGSYGSSSSSLSDLLSNPVGTLGAGLTLPFLNWEKVRLNTAISRADYERAVVTFRQTLQQALVDVDNALSARQQLAIQAEQQQTSLEATRTAERLYAVRYRAGAVPLRTWLDAQERRRSAELAFAQVHLNRLTNQVTLYQALGGGTT
ncbi:efflux transporter outer membrane subunit [Oleisolibacter albus]|uniref:efflux transporter outer membrane subunit n=1 Tax=Oleisolibacter albus TaxID=2171757 RepID=UPI000DF2D29C|nr:efflux transporter outer membrane subunit [Oleisolibacter albus]